MADWPLQYAIRPSVRGNDKFHRDSIIQTVAGVVGPEHRVDLKNYDAVILVDVIQVSHDIRGFRSTRSYPGLHLK